MRRQTIMGGRNRLSIEPSPGKDQRLQPRVVRREELGELIHAKRKRDRLTLDQAAQQCGVSTATMWRLERQGNASPGRAGRSPEPDTATLGRVTRWLGVSLDRVLDTSVSPASDGIAHARDDSTPDIVEAHLRADRNLDTQAAAALGRMFRLAYTEFQQRDHSLEAAKMPNEADQ